MKRKYRSLDRQKEAKIGQIWAIFTVCIGILCRFYPDLAFWAVVRILASFLWHLALSLLFNWRILPVIDLFCWDIFDRNQDLRNQGLHWRNEELEKEFKILYIRRVYCLGLRCWFFGRGIRRFSWILTIFWGFGRSLWFRSRLLFVRLSWGLGIIGNGCSEKRILRGIGWFEEGFLFVNRWKLGFWVDFWIVFVWNRPSFYRFLLSFGFGSIIWFVKLSFCLFWKDIFCLEFGKGREEDSNVQG